MVSRGQSPMDDFYGARRCGPWFPVDDFPMDDLYGARNRGPWFLIDDVYSRMYGSPDTS